MESTRVKGKRSISWIAAPGLFIAALIAFNMIMNYLLVPYTFTRMKVHFLEIATFDDLILGSSHAGTNINPAVWSEKTGRTAFNAAQGEQYAVDSYYLLRDACIDHEPARVIYEFDPTYWLSAQEIDSSYAGMFCEMRMSPVKIGYFFDKMWGVDFRTWTAPWYFYRRQFGNISANLYTKASQNYKDFGAATFESDMQEVRIDGFISVRPGKWDDEIVVREWNERTIQKDDVEFFLKTAEFCRREGIELVVVTTPIPAETYEAGRAHFDAAYAQMEGYAGDYGFTYLCFNSGELRDDGLTAADNFADWDGHMIESSADRFTEVLAGELAKERR